ncbi:MAG: hypothetical protein AAF411_06950 [Myxococcota bacterium]
MLKPTQPITSHPDWDFDLGDAVARALEHSALHVASFATYAPMPESFGQGAGVAVGLDIVCVTDARRGWLVLVQDDDEWDWSASATALIADLVNGEGAPYRVLCATFDAEGPFHRGALDLRRDARARIEAAFAGFFGGADAQRPGSFGPLPDAMEDAGFGCWSEDEIRSQMNEAPSHSLQAS